MPSTKPILLSAFQTLCGVGFLLCPFITPALGFEPDEPSDWELPAWAARFEDQTAPASTNCQTTSLYLAGILPDPFGFQMATYWKRSPGTPLISDLIANGKIETFETREFRKLRPGDAISAIGIVGEFSGSQFLVPYATHMYTYLGDNLAFENNPEDFSQGYLISALNPDWMPVRADGDTPTEYGDGGEPLALRKIGEIDWDEKMLAWQQSAPEDFAVYQRARTDLRALWFNEEPIRVPSPDERAAIDQTWRRCRDGWLKAQQLPPGSPTTALEEFYLFCYGTLNSYNSSLERAGRTLD